MAGNTTFTGMHEQPSNAKLQEYRIHFEYEGKAQEAKASLFQRADHDEYHVIADDPELARTFGSSVIDLYFQEPRLRVRHTDSLYMQAIASGLSAYLDAKK